MKKLIQICLIVLSCAILVLPFYLVTQNLSVRNAADFLFLLSRLFGLLAFSLIFLQIVIGSGRFFLNSLFPAGMLLKAHMTIGKIAFGLVILHPLLLLSTHFIPHRVDYLTGYFVTGNLFFLLLGITALTLLCITVSAALLRFKIGPKWINLHRLNYVVFWLIFVHGINIGFDTQSSFVRIIYFLFGTVVALLIFNRIFASFAMQADHQFRQKSGRKNLHSEKKKQNSQK